MKIMILEDDETISFALKIYLEKFGFDSTIYESLDDVNKISLNEFDLAILDANLPDGSGFEYLKWIREDYDIPVLMLTVKDSEESILKGFAYGADEYITKPFSLPILKARIDNIFSRKYDHGDRLIFHDLKLDNASKSAFVKGKNIDLSRQEYEVLRFCFLIEGQYYKRKNN